MISDSRARSALEMYVHPWVGQKDDSDPLLDQIGEAEIVLIGEASHGTHEFYQQRAELTKRLIAEKGFDVVAVEADWPDALRINHYVQNRSDDGSAVEALGDFTRFPLWMWRNEAVVEFVEWLRDFNDTQSASVGFYGLDLYSLYRSIEHVLAYLDSVDQEEAARARARYGCFDHFAEDPALYARHAVQDIDASCEQETVQQLLAMMSQPFDDADDDDALFYAQQNARLVRDAEAYYRAMYRGRAESWNLRDEHMMDTLSALREHVRRQRGGAKIIVWAHNSHLGDARATEMNQRGEINLGQLSRQAYGDDLVSIGFSTYTGTVAAASHWGGAVQRKRVRRALANSYERMFHHLGIPRFSLNLRQESVEQVLSDIRLQRAIGVIYRPQTERQSHYFWAKLPHQFDALIHIDETQALTPLEYDPDWVEDQPMETFPHGQ